MGVSLNPADVWKIFSDKKRNQKEEVAEWLEELAKDARSLADVWKKITVELLSVENTNLETQRKISDELLVKIREYRIFMPNRDYVNRLTDFYRHASIVLAGRTTPTLVDVVVNATAELLHTREKVKELYERRVKEIPLSVFSLDNGNLPTDAKGLIELTEAMARDAAALEVLARNFRVTG